MIDQIQSAGTGSPEPIQIALRKAQGCSANVERKLPVNIVKRKDESKRGDSRAQRVFPEIRDAFSETMQAGQLFQTRHRHAAPPVDPRRCHPAMFTASNS